MQRYIEQLIEDLHKATWNLKSPHQLWDKSEANPDDELELEDMSYVEKYMYGNELPISEITGIEQEQLPMPEKLDQDEQALLAVELEKLLQYFHFYLDFPQNYPHHLRYAFIRSFWSEEQVALSFGENHIEFCDYDEEKCPFPGYCHTCKEVADEMKNREEQAVDDNSDFDIADLLPSPEQIEDCVKQGNPDLKEDFPFPFNDDDDGEKWSPEEINGFYDDDGNKVDPDSVAVPGLCVICKKYQIDDWDENLLCLMNRFDQRNDADFICGVFEKI